MTITKLELEALEGIYNSDFRDGNNPVNCPVWSWSANPFGSKPRFAGAVSSLVKKGLAKTSGQGEDACVAMTAAGWDELRKSNKRYGE
jgi:hypothetical protein